MSRFFSKKNNLKALVGKTVLRHARVILKRSPVYEKLLPLNSGRGSSRGSSKNAAATCQITDCTKLLPLLDNHVFALRPTCLHLLSRVGFKTLVSAEVPTQIKQAFIQQVVYQHWIPISLQKLDTELFMYIR